MKILITDNVSEKCIQVFSKAEFILDFDPSLGKKPVDIKRRIPDCDGLVVRSATQVTPEIMDAGKKLKIIGRAGAGVDNIDVEAATKRGIIVMNTPGGNTISAAEHTFSMILALARNLPQANYSMKQGLWSREKFIGNELLGKVLGIIGLGKIGREVAKRAKAFDMRILGYDPLISKEIAAALQIELVSIEDIYRQSDFITLHLPLLEETRNLIGVGELNKCKFGVKIINCARGGLINEKDLVQALKSGQVGGAAIDVFEEEPTKNKEMIDLPNVITTPHLGASTEEAQEKVAVEIAEQMVDALLDRGVRNAVNVLNVPRELVPLVKPFIELAEELGALLVQITTGIVREVIIKYSGEVTKLPLEPITSGALMGIIRHLTEGSVNYINAIPLAKERGIRWEEIRSSEDHEFISLIELTYITDKEQHKISGTVFGQDTRLISFDDYLIDAKLDGNLIVIQNHDVRGVVGKLGTLLAKHEINIANMALGRKKQGGLALTIIGVDSRPDKSVLDEIHQLPEIEFAKVVSF